MSDTTLATDQVDHISLEVLRSRLDAIIEEASAAIQRTAISPIVTSGDYAVTLFDGAGSLVATGRGSYIAGASQNSVRHTIERYGDEIQAGDVYLANDPHNGGGLHAQDVVVLRPIYVGDRRIAWVVSSAHMMDVGGSVPGSFASGATDCFAEALRLPPVRLFRGGVEVTDVWAIFRNNVRISELVETDLRSLVAGGHVAQESIVTVAEGMGLDRFQAALDQMRNLTERELRRRIEAIADGTYRATTWAEWDDDFFKIPCTLTVDGDRMIFDFEGASPQAPHYFNSKPYIIASMFVADLAWLIAADLPYTQAIFSCLEFRCPEGTIVNAHPPAPVGASHMDVALSASEMAMQCVRLALGASTESDASRFIAGWGGYSALGVQTWSALGIDGTADAWVMQEGEQIGSSARPGHDGLNLGMITVGREIPHFGSDVEVVEAWYPILVTEKRPQTDVGVGRWRSGAGVQMGITPHGTERMVGEMLGMRRWMPLQGAAGGSVGARTQFSIQRADGVVDDLPCHVSGVVVEKGETFTFQLASGGGFGDPLDRDPASVWDDVEAGILSGDGARVRYGVVVGAAGVDDAATAACRRDLLTDRLSRATLAEREEGDQELLMAAAAALDPGADAWPLYPGVLQRGNVAFAEASGSPLAVAPSHWTSGCAVLEEPLRSDEGPPVTVRWYLDPETGQSLFVDVVPGSATRSFESLPRRWVEAARSGR